MKIQQDNEKAERVQLQKMALLEQRKIIQSQMRSEKEELMRKFEIIQKTGKIPPELVDKIGKDRLDSLNATQNNTTTRSPDTTVKKKAKEVKKEVIPIKEETVKEVVKPEMKKNLVKKVEPVDQKNDDSIKNLEKKQEKYAEIKKTKKNVDKQLKDIERTKDIEELKMKQNSELLDLLNTEQKVEEEREKDRKSVV